MRRLSSPLTPFYKRVLPALGLLALVACAAHAVWRAPHAATATLPLAGLVAAVGLLVFFKQIRPLADEVWIDGDALLVIRHHAPERIALHLVAAARTVALGQPHLVLTLHGESRRTISFLPSSTGMFGRLKPHPIAAELMERMRAAASA